MKNALLKEVCSITMGQAPPGSSYNEIGEGLPLIAGASDFGETTPEPSRYTKLASKISSIGDIILCIRATIGDRNWSDKEYCLGRGVASLRANFDELNSGYLWHWLSTAKHTLSKQARGSTFKQVDKKTIENLEVPLPPLEEQRRIAEILDKADEVRRKRQEAIRLTEELLKSLFLDMFGDPVTNPKGWEVVELCELLIFLTSGSRGWAKYYAPRGDLFLRVQNVKGGKLLLDDIAYVNPPDSAEARRTCVKEGDILFSITADLGRTAVIPKGLPNAYINQHLAIIRVNKSSISSTYLSAFLSSEGGQSQVRKLNREGVKAGLNFDDIKNLKILVPPIEIQHEYEKQFKLMSFMSNHYKEGCDSTNSLFNSLLQKAFRGEL